MAKIVNFNQIEEINYLLRSSDCCVRVSNFGAGLKNQENSNVFYPAPKFETLTALFDF